jgi:hypothetical protein
MGLPNPVNSLVKGGAAWSRRLDRSALGTLARCPQVSERRIPVENVPSEGSTLDEQPEAATEEAAPVAEAAEGQPPESDLEDVSEEGDGESLEDAPEESEQ